MNRLTSKQLEELLSLQKLKYTIDYKVDFQEWSDESIFLGISSGRYYEHDGSHYDPKAEYLTAQDWNRVKITRTGKQLEAIKKQEAHEEHIGHVRRTINALGFTLNDIAEALGLEMPDYSDYD